MYWSPIISFSGQNMLCKAGNWHALSHGQYFSKHHFLDVSRCALNIKKWHLDTIPKETKTQSTFICLKLIIETLSWQ